MPRNVMMARPVIAATLTAIAALEWQTRSKPNHFSPPTSSCESPPPHHSSFIMFLGSGSSTGCPKPRCLLQTAHPSPYCSTSLKANAGDPRNNKDYRGNPSLLIGHRPTSTSNSSSTPPSSNVVIDVGKTFREHFIRWAPQHNNTPYSIPSIDAVVLTHEHMDAYGGLDDLRGVQEHKQTLPIHLSNHTMTAVKRTYPYLIPRPPSPGEVKRHVASVDFKLFKPFSPFKVNDLSITPLPVIHGEDCTCFGFSFGTKEKVLYLSDISWMPADTSNFISSLGEIDILVLDTLFFFRSHNTHFGLKEAEELIREIKPKKCYLVGMSCDEVPPHDEANALLKKRFSDTPISVELAYDGLTLPVDL